MAINQGRYMQKNSFMGAGRILVAGRAMSSSTLAILGLVIGAPALVAASAGYLAGRLGSPVSPTYMAKSLQEEQIHNLKKTLEFRKAHREYTQGIPKEEFKEIRL